MLNTRVAIRYAQSLIELSQERKVLDEVKEDMLYIIDTGKKHKDLALLLKSPIIKTDKKKAIFEEVFGGQVNTLTLEFIKFITERKREGHLITIAEEFLNQYRKIKNIKSATVVTAVPIDEELRRKVKALVKGTSQSEVELEEKTDKSIIGGFILKIGDKEIDESISGKLNKLKRSFSDNPYVKEI